MSTTAQTLYGTVGQLGLTRAQARRLLPEWWDPGLEKAPGGVSELAVLLARRLSIDAGALLQGRLLPKGAVSSLSFKHRAGLEPEQLAPASFIASSLAQTVLAAFSTPYSPLPNDPNVLRASVVSTAQRILGFDSLLTACWDYGVPVIPLPHLPVGVRKMDGAALQVGGRPVIVIAKKKSSRAWLSFILAHEIGHIACGHLRPGSTIVDVSLQESATYAAEADADLQEAQADAFAIELMGGAIVGKEVAAWPVALSPVEVAVRARNASQRLGVEAGHFILRKAFLTKRWPDAMNALRFLSEDFDPESVLLGEFRRRLDLDSLSDDMQGMVAQVTGWDGTR
ncbi:MAG: hypothetical protein DI563_02630 [Variovorax paradoxus]|uniref:IrrE N-terminal-like domain-containing protein n=1 Tax=Variovorax paradoxus TaxID=34073 RepID=A0A2W5QLI2_VARPD|nr:MAG: hypothetical protein DI563_02630 [Variovorax paradoxus]